MIPESALTTFSTTTEDEKEFTTYLFDFDKGDFVLQDGKLIEVEGEEALRVWIEKILKTELDVYEIYKDEVYGTGIQSLIVGNAYPLDFIKAEIQREISEALLSHPFINSVTDLEISKVDDDLQIAFTVNHTLEVSYSV